MSSNSTDSEFYQKIEEKHEFSVPTDYRKMWERGWFSLHGPATEEQFFEPGKNYLLMSDMQWYSPKQIAEKEFPRFIKPTVPVVPFAFTGGGDWWCWQTDRVSRKWGTAVLLCLRDGGAIVYAPNFAAAVFRQALELASSPGQASLKGKQATPEGKERVANTSKHLKRYVADLPLIWPTEWCAILADLAFTNPFWWELSVPNGSVFDCYSVLDDRERKRIEKTLLGVAEKEKTIEWF